MTNTTRLKRKFEPIMVSLGVAMLLIASSHRAFCEEAVSNSPTHFAENVEPFLAEHCVGCHSGNDAEGGVALDRYVDSAYIQQDYALWEKIIRLVREHQMPPPDEPQPSSDEIIAVSAAIEVELSSFDCTSEKHPGRVTIRRLNKAEYNNTIRDLTGLELNLADDFPSDDVGAGFDNIGDVLTIPPILLEKYLGAAEQIANAIFADEAVRKRVFPHEPTGPEIEEIVAVARRNISEFATKAFRRPLHPDEEERLFGIMRFAWEQNGTPDEIFKTVVTAVLSSPHFLFRVEQDPAADDEDGIRELDGYELASRLSYFLWSSMPDQRLFDLAASGELTKHEVLASESRRMLADPKSRALVDNFAGQWLQLRDLPRLMPDPELFPDFDGDLRSAMRRETEMFFEEMIREDRSVLEFLNADYTFVNERLARHYAIPDVTGNDFQRVSLEGGRRGVLTHASILMLTSNPTRTSPVKRGKWILDNILAQPPSPPPPSVPELEEGAETLGSLRERMEQHRSNPTCASCHRTMDALGFGLENFDAVGAWRDRDGRSDIDASGELPGGHEFDGASELMVILAEDKKEAFCKCLAAKMMTFALGRGLSSYDRCSIKNSVTALSENDYRFSVLVTSIVTSDPFTLREARKAQ